MIKSACLSWKHSRKKQLRFIHKNYSWNYLKNIDTKWVISFVTELTIPITVLQLTFKKKKGLLALFWLMVKNKNIEMTAHIVFLLKRDAGGNHQQNKKQNAAIITLGYPVLSYEIYQWPPCLRFDLQSSCRNMKQTREQKWTSPYGQLQEKKTLQTLTNWTKTTEGFYSAGDLYYNELFLYFMDKVRC